MILGSSYCGNLTYSLVMLVTYSSHRSLQLVLKLGESRWITSTQGKLRGSPPQDHHISMDPTIIIGRLE